MASPQFGVPGLKIELRATNILNWELGTLNWEHLFRCFRFTQTIRCLRCGALPAVDTGISMEIAEIVVRQ
jgi:hypothetical protein